MNGKLERKNKRNTPLFITGLFAALILVSFLFVTAFSEKKASGSKADGTQVTVVTSFYPMYIAALNLVDGVSGIQLENLSEPQTGCLHDYQMVPADMELLTVAQVFIINGGGMEGFLSDVTARLPQLTVIDTSESFAQNMALHEEEEEHEHAHETEDGHEDEHAHETDGGSADEHEHHHHGDINAHFWLSIPLYRKQVEAMADGLASYFESEDMIAKLRANEEAYLVQIDELIAEQERLRSKLQGRPVILFHEGFAYIADDYGMSVVSVMDLDEERQISAGEVAGIVDVIRSYGDGSPAILAEELYGKEMADSVKKEVDVEVDYLDPIVRAEGDFQKDAYIQRMRANIELLEGAVQR